MKRVLSYIFVLALVSCGPGGPRPAPPELVAALSDIIERELENKSIPALSIAVVDDQDILWAEGFGFTDLERTAPATADTVYRVGSVSKLFTDIAVMSLVEQGTVDLDAPLTTYLPDLELDNPYDTEVTLRQLMAHRSGLVREPPVGNYFDPSEPTLRATVESLNHQPIVYEPGSRTKYSNAGIAIVGYVLENLHGQPFIDYVRTNVLDRFGMLRSDFEPSARVRDQAANGVMWTYDGRRFEAPTFQLGMAPAGSLYSSVTDLGSFMSALFRGGDGVVSPETLEAMLEPQFRDSDQSASYGLGFSVQELDGERLIGHGGAIYGFSTEFMFLPDRKLGVVAVASKDFANSIVDRIARHALRTLIAVDSGARPPYFDTTDPLPPERVKEIARRYNVVARGDRLFAERGTRQVEVRERAGALVVDSPLAFGAEIDLSRIGMRELQLPPDMPPHWRGIIGEYGWDHNTLYILEKDEKLHALIEWFESYPLTEHDESRFAFPAYGLYHGEELVFERDASGRASAVVAAGVRFERRDLGTVEGETFRIQPLRPVDELRGEALAAAPPDEGGNFRLPDLIEPTALDESLRLDIRYATTNNFMGSVFYDEPRAFLQRPAAEALVRAHQRLASRGYGILIHDAYRPWYVTKMFYDATPEAQKIFVADPASGSRHNRGAAADITLYELASGEVVEMVGGYDEFSPRSFPDYPGGTSRQRFLREMLRTALEDEGFAVYEFEWWHFDYGEWSEYPIMNDTFEALER